MSNNVVTPYFKENSYKGQDIVHYGIRIPFNKTKEEILNSFSRNAQRIIKKKHPFSFRDATNKDIVSLRKLWFDEHDTTFPDKFEKTGHYGLVGIKNNIIHGGIILKKSGQHFFLHQLIASPDGKTHQLPTLLIWEALKKFHDEFSLQEEIKGIDIGVSYNPKRYKFFKNFAVETYPVILKRPFYVPVIRLSPFRGFNIPEATKEPVNWLSDSIPTTILPRGNYALLAILKYLQIGRDDEVLIVKTWSTKYITGCVTETINKTEADWSLRDTITKKTKAVLVLHEFGIPVFEKKDISLLKEARTKKIPIIEDCAWRDDRVFPFSDYWFFSAQKMANINFGGVLKGVAIPDDKLWEYGCLDFVKKERLKKEIKNLSINRAKRASLWMRYHELVLSDGMTPDDQYDYETAVREGRWTPTVYMQKFENDEIANALVERLVDFGIQTGRYWGTASIFLPIHNNMTPEEIDYIFAVVRGYFNLCHEYEGK